MQSWKSLTRYEETGFRHVVGLEEGRCAKTIVASDGKFLYADYSRDAILRERRTPSDAAAVAQRGPRKETEKRENEEKRKKRKIAKKEQKKKEINNC